MIQMFTNYRIKEEMDFYFDESGMIQFTYTQTEKTDNEMYN